MSASLASVEEASDGLRKRRSSPVIELEDLKGKYASLSDRQRDTMQLLVQRFARTRRSASSLVSARAPLKFIARG